MMVDLTAPQPGDEICDPAAGTCGFLVAAADYLRREHPSVMTDETQRRHFHRSMFHGYDFDSTMLRIGSMNMLLHGVEQPDVRYRDSLSEGSAAEEGVYSLVLANPPFAGSLDDETTSKDLLRVVRTKKTELLFLALFLRLLKARSARTPVSPPRSFSSRRPTTAAPTMSGSTTCRPTAGASTTSGRRYCPPTSSARAARRAREPYAVRSDEPGQEQPARRARAGGA